MKLKLTTKLMIASNALAVVWFYLFLSNAPLVLRFVILIAQAGLLLAAFLIRRNQIKAIRRKYKQ